MRTKYFREPFALAGDVTAVADAAQGNGKISINQGWTPDYQKDLATDASAKPIDRTEMNWLFKVLTENLRYWQTETYPEFITATDNNGAAFPYPLGVIVRFRPNAQTAFTNYLNTVEGNAKPPTDANSGWLNATSLLANAVSKTGDTMSGPLAMQAATVIAPLLSDKSDRVINAAWATTGFLQANFPLTGYIKLPAFLNGITLQWGESSMPPSGGPTTATSIVFPLSFNAIVGTVQVTPKNGVNSQAGNIPLVRAADITTSGCNLVADSNNTVIFNQVTNYSWLAIGI